VDPTLVPIPRKVRLRPGRVTGPVVLGWAFQLMQLAALYDVIRPLWCIFCFCTKGHSLKTVPVPPWDRWLGVSIQSPFSALLQIVIAGALFFVIGALADWMVWKGKREKDLLVKGRAMQAKVIKAHSDKGKHWITYSFTRDGELHEQEVQVKSPKAVGDEVAVLFTFDYSQEMLYEHCRYQLAG